MHRSISEQGFSTLRLIALLLSILAAYFTCWTVLMFADVPSGSMYPTLNQGDVIVALRAASPESVKREDIISFCPVTEANANLGIDPSALYVKRVIGLPGDTIEISDGILYVNGEAQSRSYTAEEKTSDFALVTVPENSFFVMGDNRNYSMDSRFIGFIPFANFRGNVVFHSSNYFLSLLRAFFD